MPRLDFLLNPPGGFGDIYENVYRKILIDNGFYRIVSNCSRNRGKFGNTHPFVVSSSFFTLNFDGRLLDFIFSGNLEFGNYRKSNGKRRPWLGKYR